MHPLKLINIAWRMSRHEPTFVSFNVTNRCTQRCPMCEVWRSPSEELSVGEITRIFTDLRRTGVAAVEISGGEPFLRTDIFEILDALDDLGFVYSVNTNGTLLTAEKITRLASCRGLLQLAISIDSLDRERYAQLRGADSLPDVLHAIDLVTSTGSLRAKINVTMSRLNHREIPDLLAFAKAHGMGMSVFPVIQGAGLAHRSHDAMFDASDEERALMAAAFRRLATLRRQGEPLWEYSGYYEVAAEYVEGRAIGECDAGRVFFDLRANGDFAACVDLPAFTSLRTSGADAAMSLVRDEHERIRECSSKTPCCYTCTANISETARHPVRFALESARVRLRAGHRAPKTPAGPPTEERARDRG